MLNSEELPASIVSWKELVLLLRADQHAGATTTIAIIEELLM